ncbi:uncharacterized protein PGTG_19328 [Puccinia graminis f. sp. tritici CRL 75-36-700-3]|uniref:Uncharacterized protein n=1 Tax=Puccinia graminis f. sp. tritici (strain CRL 75-36-700-3 / race SCCL) TaxID=418459 RepID=E3L9Q6_PUCGT|nr:uncharacterized protein PGTG_19328 [Puccinia graminis f. sp. tritici CRL 75-36-700-3]EFP93281.1 hypothetical protein PGTG_19328 [Puccinia graminis f. sp. tritici CRL 75-36-700-3]
MLDEGDQKEFVRKMDWPFKLIVFGEENTLVSRGFFSNSHYWGNVLRHANGLLGVWSHNDQLNAGRAHMVNAIPGSISGAQEHTSWLFYSRCWTPEEAAFVGKSTAQLLKDNPRLSTQIPFTRMDTLLKVSHNGEVPVPSISITQEVKDGNIQDSGGSFQEQPLKIRTRRPANSAKLIAPTTLAQAPEITPDTSLAAGLGETLDTSNSDWASAKRSCLSKTGTSLATPGAVLDNPPSKRIRPNKVLPISAPEQAPKVGNVPAKCGRPKKARKVKTSITFKPEPLEDADWERIQARAAAYWRDKWEANPMMKDSNSARGFKKSID